MEVKVTEKSPIVRVMEITEDSERVEAAYVKAFKEALTHLSIPGFRRGKVPAYIGRKHIPNSVLKAPVAEDLVNRLYSEALEKEGLRPVSQPRFTAIDVERGKNLTCEVSFEVIPQVDLKDYKGLDQKQERYEPTEKDVEDTLTRIRESRAQLVKVEEGRGLQENDIAYVDFTSAENGQELPHGSAKNFPMELNPGKFVPGFLEHLYGMKPGESREFEQDFPADYPSELAGKHVSFKFNLHSISAKVLPELNDEFAKIASEFSTLDEFRQHIKKAMQDQIQGQVDQQIAEKIYVAIAEQIPVEMVPTGLAAYQASVYQSNVERQLHQQHSSIAQLMKARGMSDEDWKKQVFMMGFGEARMEVMVRNIARLENVTVSDDEMEDVVAGEARRLGQSHAYVWKQMEKNGTVEVLRYSMLRDKITKLLVEATNVTYVAPGTLKAEEEQKEKENAAKSEEASQEPASENKE